MKQTVRQKQRQKLCFQTLDRLLRVISQNDVEFLYLKEALACTDRSVADGTGDEEEENDVEKGVENWIKNRWAKLPIV